MEADLLFLKDQPLYHKLHTNLVEVEAAVVESVVAVEMTEEVVVEVAAEEEVPVMLVAVEEEKTIDPSALIINTQQLVELLIKF